MHFLTSGDFGFPFSWVFYFLKQFFLWSYQSGAANLDGVIRMPGRIVHLLVFVVFGNVAFDYFYLISSIVIAFVGFFYFATKVLKVDSLSARLFGALFFALNPIFLGNFAKIGLILAAAMLPLCLAMVHQGIHKKQFRYFLLWLLFLNISLIHPFNFTVNIVVSGGYFLFLANQHRRFIFSNFHKFFLVGVLAILMNLYFLLPIASMRTLNKSVLSDTIVSTPTDYTALVDVLNTGDVLTGLSLSRNVLLDFNFYNDAYAKLYFVGVFVFYILLFGMFIKHQKHLLEKDMQRFVLILAAFAVLVVLATVTVFNVGELIKLLIQLPGGWTFRSPLKWQLYIPLALAAMLAILLEYVTTRRWRLAICGGLIASFILMNGYILADISVKLLTPRSIEYFSALQKIDFKHDSMLFISGDRCATLQQQNPRVMAEFNQIMSSKYVQLKRIGANDIGLVNLASYDYVMDCNGSMAAGLAETYDFKTGDTFAGGLFELYHNTNAQPYVYAVDTVTTLDAPDRLDDYYYFSKHTLERDLNFVDAAQEVSQPTTAVQNVFENMSFKNIKSGTIDLSVTPIHSGSQKLYVQPSGDLLYYRVQDNRITLATSDQPGYLPLSADNTEMIDVAIGAGQDLKIDYDDPSHPFQNLIPNPSLEDGLWQKKVGDCYDFDDLPSIDMKLNKSQASEGRQSLQLESANHIACSGPNSIPVQEGQTYLLSFDYQSLDRSGSYSVVFNDQQKTFVRGRLLNESDGWQTFTRVISVPEGATNLRLTLNAHPASAGVGVARYDNFKLAAIPDVGERFYLVSEPSRPLQYPAKISYALSNPTKTSITISGATEPFYLATGETYNDTWRLAYDTGTGSSWLPFGRVAAIDARNHLRLNGSNNAWYINPAEICKDASRCQRSADGSYTIRLVMEFTPQRWFYVGTIISGLTFAGIIGFVVWDWRRKKDRGEHYRSD